jgi:hypothetical protein
MKVRILSAIAALAGVAAFAQTKTQPVVEVNVIVTAADHVHHAPAPLKPADLSIMDATITGWTPLNGANGHLELFLLIDDNSNYPFGSKLQELKKFVTSQPPATAVGIAYIHEGNLQIVENPTVDHVRAARALRAPSGSKAANPYCEISDLIQNWLKGTLPAGTVRREIVLVSTGIDDSVTNGAVCVNAEKAIQDAERANVVIYALYNPVADYLSRKWTTVDAGVVDLAHVCFETGGEAYFLSHVPVETIQPFLEDIAEHLAHQYLVKFRISPLHEGGFEPLYINAETPGLEIMAPEKVWIPPAGE